MSPDCVVLLCSSVHYVVIRSEQLLPAAISVLQASYLATSIINPQYNNHIRKKCINFFEQTEVIVVATMVMSRQHAGEKPSECVRLLSCDERFVIPMFRMYLCVIQQQLN